MSLQRLYAMIIDRQLLTKLMHLARLELNEGEEAAMLSDLNKICAWIEKLNELDTQGVQPLTGMSLEQNVLREDIPHESLAHDKGLASAPSSDSNYFRVPKVKD